MKKLISLLLALVLMLGSTTAMAAVNVTGMTTTELTTLINSAMAELEKRANRNTSKVIVDKDGIYLALTDSMIHENGYYMDQHFMLKNNSAYDLTLSVKKVKVNGWDVERALLWVGSSGYKSKTLEAGSNYRDLYFEFDDVEECTGVKSAGEIKTVVFVISLEQYVSSKTKRTINVEVSCVASADGTLKVTSYRQVN
ncbi:MAG: hypothetical protein IJ343_09310 [Clostridia bacterium]|nr:hypothetical protein [Clostridia bacterium]